MTRDGHSFDEACEIMRTNHRVTATTGDLEQLSAQIPRRVKRRFQDDQVLANVPTPDLPPDELLIDNERQASMERCRAAVGRAVAQLGEQDRLILAFRFRDGRTVREIADILRHDYKSLFRRIDQILRQLRKLLEQDGIARLDGFDLPIEIDREDHGGGGPEEGSSGSSAPVHVPRQRGPADRRRSAKAADAQQSGDSETEETSAALSDWCDSEQEKQWLVRL